jgi:signal transduction histidine kinase
MKLFTKYNRVNIAVTILAFTAGSVAFYFVLHYVLVRQLDETLRAEKQEITEYVKQHNQLPEIQNTKHQWIIVEETTQPVKSTSVTSKLVYDKKEDDDESIRQMVFSITANGKSYNVSVNKSETETEDLLQLIIYVTIAMIGFILLLNYIVNRKLITALWKPFYTTIDSIKQYNISQHQPLQLSTEQIDEIDLLNKSLNAMTTNIYNDYYTLKSFTENASHEMQTPLAVIRSKVELLLQQTEWKEQSLQHLMVIENATQKLAKLNQSLLLLTKLENRQFILNEEVNLAKIVNEKLDERNELIQAKQLQVSINCEEVTLAFHQHLAEILISNLLNNAIRYTTIGGEINISLNKKELQVSNTATNGTLDNDKIFQRFYKTETSTEGTGLGLAIIKEICNAGGFDLQYSFLDNKHSFSVHF